jgi:hypothetical protein
MTVSTLTLKRSTGKGRAKKTRTFSVRLMGYLQANFLWDRGVGDEVRPTWIAYLGTESESQAFTSNFRGGHKAETTRKTFKLPKTAPHRWTTQKVPGGLITTAYLPELFHLEPAFPAPERVRFVLAPPRWWIDRQVKRLESDHGAQARELARAALFAAYLDRRTPLPVLGELAFHLQLFRAAREADWVYEPEEGSLASAPFQAVGAQTCGLDEPLAVSAPQKTISEFLIDQTSSFTPKESPHGTDRLAPERRLLPHAPSPAAVDQHGSALA